jgi:hypothetical protein
MFKARRFEAKKALIRLLFKRFEKRLGISTPDVEIRIFETPRSNWGFRGLRATITYPKKLLGTTYSDYDSQIRTQMTTLFHDAGLRPRWKDFAAGNGAESLRTHRHRTLRAKQPPSHHRRPATGLARLRSSDRIAPDSWPCAAIVTSQFPAELDRQPGVWQQSNQPLWRLPP